MDLRDLKLSLVITHLIFLLQNHKLITRWSGKSLEKKTLLITRIYIIWIKNVEKKQQNYD